MWNTHYIRDGYRGRISAARPQKTDRRPVTDVSFVVFSINNLDDAERYLSNKQQVARRHNCHAIYCLGTPHKGVAVCEVKLFDYQRNGGLRPRQYLSDIASTIRGRTGLSTSFSSGTNPIFGNQLLDHINQTQILPPCCMAKLMQKPYTAQPTSHSQHTQVRLGAEDPQPQVDLPWLPHEDKTPSHPEDFTYTDLFEEMGLDLFEEDQLGSLP